MDRLPEEILVHIFSFLDALDLASAQFVSRHWRSVGRDNSLWKALCYKNSQQEARRRRNQAILDQESRLAALRNAIENSLTPDTVEFAATFGAFPSDQVASGRRRRAAFSNWDPAYPDEHVNFYDEFVHRHAPVSLRYFETPKDSSGSDQTNRESLGVGVIADTADGDARKLLSPLDDGSICIWDTTFNSITRGKIMARSSPGLLQGDSSRESGQMQQQQRQLTTETGAVDNVSVDRAQQKAFVSIESHLHEIDLNTLAVIRRLPFPFPITALSEAKNPTPLTVGTNMTLHLYDPRVGRPQLGVGLSTRCELIAGAPTVKDPYPVDVSSAHVTLSQPGPLSILHLPGGSPLDIPLHSIWVAGRFTSLLHYDRRFWPRIEGTLFSGARLSSLSAIPYPFVHPRLRAASSYPQGVTDAKHASGITIIAAGEYKGKGSLELYGLPQEDRFELSQPSSDASDPLPAPQQQFYHNRQYASRSRLLSVAPHGARIVFSDGDGILKWVERDAWSVVRSFNINDASALSPHADTPTVGGLFAPQPSDDPNSDIVQKILPLQAAASGESNSSDLVVWTGDGRLGLVGFGSKARQPFGVPAAGAAAAAADAQSRDGHGDSDDVRMREEEDERERERVYAGRMREALERQADETRWVRGLGLGFR